jgi:hypothetical protein
MAAFSTRAAIHEWSNSTDDWPRIHSGCSLCAISHGSCRRGIPTRGHPAAHSPRGGPRRPRRHKHLSRGRRLRDGWECPSPAPPVRARNSLRNPTALSPATDPRLRSLRRHENRDQTDKERGETRDHSMAAHEMFPFLQRGMSQAGGVLASGRHISHRWRACHHDRFLKL